MDRKRYRLGVELRRDIFGESYVEKQTKGNDPDLQAWQDYVHEFVWGGIWGRPGLSRKTRSLLNLAMLSVLGAREELKLHLQGALRNGATRQEIVEVLLQTAMYGGAPRGAMAFSVAREVFSEGRARQRVSRKMRAVRKARIG